MNTYRRNAIVAGALYITGTVAGIVKGFHRSAVAAGAAQAVPSALPSAA